MKKLFARRERGDFVAVCGAVPVSAHLAVLEAECGYFRAMAETLVGDGARATCALHWSPDAFESVLACVYALGLPALGMRETLDVLALAVFLDCGVAERAATERIAATIDAECALQCWHEARAAGAIEAARVATRCVGRGLALVARTPAFLALSLADLTLLLSADELAVRSECAVASALGAWCEANGALCAPLDGVVRYPWRELPEREPPGVRGVVALPWGSARPLLLDEALEWVPAFRSLDSPRGTGCGVCHFAGATYAVGGTNRICAAERQVGGRWTSYDYKLSRSEVACALLGATMYVAGGVLGLCPCRDVDVYDLARGLKGKVYMRTPRRMCCAAGTDGALLVAGGIGAAGAALARAELYVPRLGWRDAPAMRCARAAAACAAVGDDVYVAGGVGAAHAQVDTAEYYDAARGAWVPLPPMPSPRSHCGGAAMAGAFYVLGGLEDGVPATTYLRLDGGRWSVHAAPPLGECAACSAG